MPDKIESIAKEVDRKTGGHTSITDTLAGRTAGSDIGPTITTKPHTPVEVKSEVNRSVTGKGSGGAHRGDRRDMSKTYTGNEKHAARGNTPRADVKTRKR